MRKDWHVRHWVVLGVLLATQVGCAGGGASGPEAGGVGSSPPTPPTAGNPAPGQPGTGGSTAAPQIMGTPATEVAAGDAYQFQPSVSDSQGGALIFSVVNLPSWAQFDASTGRLSGTPTAGDVGVYRDISIRVSNASRQSALAAFSISVVQVGQGTATVSWVAPAHNTDGSVLQNLKGFFVHYGRSPSGLDRAVRIGNPSVSSYVVDNLTTGTWYFAVSAFNSRNVESALSTVGSKLIE